MKRLNWYISAVFSGVVLACALLTFVFSSMNVRQFIELVQSMRIYQNAYYKNGRKQSDLIVSKQLEKEVDRALLDGISFPVEAVLDDAKREEQRGLFEQENEQ